MIARPHRHGLIRFAYVGDRRDVKIFEVETSCAPSHP